MSDDAVAEILRRDPRFPRAAYDFVREALRHTVEKRGSEGHVTARQLLDGIRDYARSEFGPLARLVFDTWGVQRTADFGDIVFNLVEAQEMGKTDEDRKSDFDDVYTFETAFPIETGEVKLVKADADEDE